ncbi:MAG: RDD family protein [Prevotella sp.]|nr:RDD family protein [Prevotella sp.]
MPEANIVTGQYVEISQTPASVGERILAQLIDCFLLFCYLLGITLLISEMDFNGLRSEIFFTLGIYLPALFYSFLMELFNHGQSLGKMVMHLRVVKKDGTTPGVGDFFMRWLLQIIDMGFSFIGVLIILLTRNSQRLGDLAAGTMVIRLNDYRKIQVSLDEFSYLDRNYQPVYPQAENLSLNQIDVIQRTLNAEYSAERDRHIAALAKKVRNLLSISDTTTADEKLLYTIVRDYQHYTLEIV